MILEGHGGDRNDNTHSEEGINADEDEFCGLERNLVMVEKVSNKEIAMI
jgi:hypothetical protein